MEPLTHACCVRICSIWRARNLVMMMLTPFSANTSNMQSLTLLQMRNLFHLGRGWHTGTQLHLNKNSTSGSRLLDWHTTLQLSYPARSCLHWTWSSQRPAMFLIGCIVFAPMEFCRTPNTLVWNSFTNQAAKFGRLCMDGCNFGHHLRVTAMPTWPSSLSTSMCNLVERPRPSSALQVTCCIYISLCNTCCKPCLWRRMWCRRFACVFYIGQMCWTFYDFLVSIPFLQEPFLREPSPSALVEQALQATVVAGFAESMKPKHHWALKQLACWKKTQNTQEVWKCTLQFGNLWEGPACSCNHGAHQQLGERWGLVQNKLRKAHSKRFGHKTEGFEVLPSKYAIWPFFQAAIRLLVCCWRCCFFLGSWKANMDSLTSAAKPSIFLSQQVGKCAWWNFSIWCPQGQVHWQALGKLQVCCSLWICKKYCSQLSAA